MPKAKSTTEEDVRASVSSLYASLLSRRKQDAEQKRIEREAEKERRKAEKESEENSEEAISEEEKLSKKERKKKELANWQQVIMGLTGEELEYSTEQKKSKKKRKKYKQWISLPGESDSTPTKKQKKPKKKNYKKEFDPELTMLKTLVAEQNRFTSDLQRRFNNAAGPATKDAAPLSKTMVELASAINVSRGNALSTLRTIGDVKKTIAQLYHKQAEIDMKQGGKGGDDASKDLGLFGSSVIQSLDQMDNPYLAPMPSVSSAPSAPAPQPTPMPGNPPMQTATTQVEPNPQIIPMRNPQPTPTPTSIELDIPEYDASQWGGPEITSKEMLYENIPHEIVVKRNPESGQMRFAAVSPGTDEEIPGCPVPSYDPNTRPVNEQDQRLKGHFDDSYRVVNE